jgi:hypothetical protein
MPNHKVQPRFKSWGNRRHISTELQREHVAKGIDREGKLRVTHTILRIKLMFAVMLHKMSSYFV